MTTALGRAVDALSNPSVSLTDALRALLVVARRIGAESLTTWLRAELDGYSAGEKVPDYRDGSHLPIKLRFAGYGDSRMTAMVQASELPEHLARAMKDVQFRQPLAELVDLAGGNSDPAMPLANAWVAEYRRLADQGLVPHYVMMQLNSAGATLPTTHLNGILDRIRTTALDMALSLEDVSHSAGSAGGPTVADEPQLAKAVTLHLTQIFGAGATVTIGSGNAIAGGTGATAIQLNAGDVDGLLRAAAALVGEEGVADLRAALEADGGEPGAETKTFLDRVKAGGYLLATGISTNGAYDGLVHLLGQVFG